MKYLSFPWEQLGNMLRGLSLSGGAGNVTAWILYIFFCLSPILLLLWLIVKGKGRKADLLLPLLSVTLFVGLWFLINPSYLEAKIFPTGLGEMGKYAFALTIDSILLTWLLLRFLTEYGKMERKELLSSLQMLLGIYIVLMVVALFVQGVNSFVSEWAALRAGNSVTGEEWMVAGFAAEAASGRNLTVSCAFLILQILCSNLPELLELMLCGAVMLLLHSCREDGFSEKSLKCVERIKSLSAHFLAAVLLSNMGINLLQLLLAKWIYSSNYSIVFPLKEVLVLLGILMLSRFYLESRQLKQDNELFI